MRDYDVAFDLSLTKKLVILGVLGFLFTVLMGAIVSVLSPSFIVGIAIYLLQILAFCVAFDMVRLIHFPILQLSVEMREVEKQEVWKRCFDVYSVASLNTVAASIWGGMVEMLSSGVLSFLLVTLVCPAACVLSMISLGSPKPIVSACRHIFMMIFVFFMIIPA